MSNEQIAGIRVSDISPRPARKNGINISRPISAPALLSLIKSIARDGLIEPLVLDQDNQLIAGGHRFEACKIL